MSFGIAIQLAKKSGKFKQSNNSTSIWINTSRKALDENTQKAYKC